MPSSLTASRPVEPTVHLDTPPLLDLLSDVTDHRDRRGRRHHLNVLLATTPAAVAAGAKTYLAIAEWIHEPTNTSVADLGVDLRRRPSGATIRRALSDVDANLLDRVLGTWMWTRTATVGGRRVIAVDGKTVRGARTPSDPASRAPHLVSAFDHTSGTVLGQLAVDAKSNEIPALRRLLDQFDLADSVVTADALHCQEATAAHIVNAGGAYLLTIKGNQPGLLAWAKRKRWKTMRPNTVTEFGHGSRVTRTTKVLQVTADESGFPHARQLVQVRRTRTVYPAGGSGRKPKKSVEVV